MRSNFLLASTTLLFASIAVAQATHDVEARNLHDVHAKSDLNLARQSPGRWTCDSSKQAVCCDSGSTSASQAWCDAASKAGSAATTFSPCPSGKSPQCCSTLASGTYDSGGCGVFANHSGAGCSAPLGPGIQPYTCETSKQALCCNTDGMDPTNPVGCLGPKVPSTTTVIGGRNLYYACAASKTPRCCTSSAANTSNPNGNMGGTGCVAGGPTDAFGV